VYHLRLQLSARPVGLPERQLLRGVLAALVLGDDYSRLLLAPVKSTLMAGETLTVCRVFFAMKVMHSDYTGQAHVMAMEQKLDSRRDPFSLTSRSGFSIAIPSGLGGQLKPSN